MKNLLIGSRALEYWAPIKICTDKTDWDIISDTPIEGAEWHDPALLNNAEFERYASVSSFDFNGHELHVVNIVGLSIIKRSHLWRSLGFSKHITHYHKHLINAVPLYTDEDREMLAKRTRLTHEAFPQKGPNLKQTVADFFDDAVTKKFSHDWLHELYAYEDKPIYTLVQRDPSIAWCEKDMWDDLSHAQKLSAVAEEAYVIATERFLVPSEFKTPYKLAYMKAVEKICTTLCKGWFRDFAIDHYPEVVNMFYSGKMDKVKSILEC